MQVDYLSYDERRHSYYLELKDSGDSNAIIMPNSFDKITVMLSSVSGGNAKVQYSLSTLAKVKADSAIWHDWSVGNVSSEGGTSFDSPIAFIKVVAGASVNYALEVLV